MSQARVPRGGRLAAARLLLTAIACTSLVFALAVGCTADDDDLEGRPCDVNQPREKQCISGYKCTCVAGNADSCVCKRSGLTQVAPDDVHASPGQGAAPARRAVQHARPVDDDPSKRLLRRLGVDVQ